MNSRSSTFIIACATYESIVICMLVQSFTDTYICNIVYIYLAQMIVLNVFWERPDYSF